MIVTGTVTYGQILVALDIENIPGIAYRLGEEITFEEVDVDPIDLPESLTEECSICGGGWPEPGHEINSDLIEDFIHACMSGDIATARALVGRVFEDRSDAALAERCLQP